VAAPQPVFCGCPWRTAPGQKVQEQTLRRNAAGLEYNFIPVTIKHKDAAVVLWRHNNVSPTALSLGDAWLTRRHNEAARRMQQLIQHHAVRFPHCTLVRILPYDLKQLDRMIGAGLQQTRAFERNGSPSVSVRSRRSSEARRCSPALPVPPAPTAVVHTKNAVPPAALFQHERAQRLRHAYAFCVVPLRRELSVPSLCSPDGSVGCDHARHSWRTWSELGQKMQASMRNCRQAASACGG
jgi:hypothetical protein